MMCSSEYAATRGTEGLCTNRIFIRAHSFSLVFKARGLKEDTCWVPSVGVAKE